MMRTRLAKIVVVAVLVPIFFPVERTLAKQLTLFAPGEDANLSKGESATPAPPKFDAPEENLKIPQEM